MNRTILATGVLVMFLGYQSPVVGLDFEEQHIIKENLLLEKEKLIKIIEEAKKINPHSYTKSSYEKLSSSIKEAEETISSIEVCRKEIRMKKLKLEKNIRSLNVLNIIEFEHENNNMYITLSKEI